MKQVTVILLFLFSLNKVHAKLNVSSTIYPIYLISQAVGGDTIYNNLIIGNGTSPHTFSPKPSTSKMINNSDIIFYIDESFEISLKKFFRNKSNIFKLIGINNLKLIQLEHIDKDNNHNHENHAESHQHDSIIDPHIWLNTENSKAIARYIAKVFTDYDPSNKDIYLKNLNYFISQMNNLKITISKETKHIKDLNWASYHNAYNYFIDEFSLKRPITLTYNPEKSLSGKTLLATRHKIKNNNVTCMINESEFKNTTSKNIAKELNLKTFQVSPLGNEKKGDNYSNIFLEISNTLAKCIK